MMKCIQFLYFIMLTILILVVLGECESILRTLSTLTEILQKYTLVLD